MNIDLQISPAKLGQDFGLKHDRVGESMRPDKLATILHYLTHLVRNDYFIWITWYLSHSGLLI